MNHRCGVNVAKVKVLAVVVVPELMNFTLCVSSVAGIDGEATLPATFLVWSSNVMHENCMEAMISDEGVRHHAPHHTWTGDELEADSCCRVIRVGDGLHQNKAVPN